eukprot:gene36700-59849_t
MPKNSVNTTPFIDVVLPRCAARSGPLDRRRIVRNCGRRAGMTPASPGAYEPAGEDRSARRGELEHGQIVGQRAPDERTDPQIGHHRCQRRIGHRLLERLDQLVDRTWGRPDTFHDVGGPADEPGTAGPVHHQSFADPYDADLRSRLVAAARRTGVDVVDGGTMVVINGPRFSTRAESRWFRSMGWHVVNMTGYPESALT